MGLRVPSETADTADDWDLLAARYFISPVTERSVRLNRAGGDSAIGKALRADVFAVAIACILGAAIGGSALARVDQAIERRQDMRPAGADTIRLVDTAAYRLAAARIVSLAAESSFGNSGRAALSFVGRPALGHFLRAITAIAIFPTNDAVRVISATARSIPATRVFRPAGDGQE